jgi:uncharacterized protein YeaO (DUF488 family)
VAIRVVRLGTARSADEGPRLGTVRRPPRGVPKSQFASGNWYDVWLPLLAPSDATLKLGRGVVSDADWRRFARRYRAEMAQPGPSQALALLAALSHGSNFSVGCYCEDEARCHRSLLRALLLARGARVR